MSMKEIEPLLVSQPEAAGLLHICVKKLQVETLAGKIPFVKVGRRTLYRPESLRRWIEEQEEGGDWGNQ